MSPEFPTPSREEIREMVLSWRINDAVKMALADGRVLLTLLELLREDDATTKTRVMMALYEVLKSADDTTRMTVLERGFPELLAALESGDRRLTVKALRVLSALTRGLPLRADEFIMLVDVIVRLGKNPEFEFASIEMADLVAHLTASHPTLAVRSKVSWLVSQENPRLKAMGLRLLLNVFASTGDSKVFVTLLEGASEVIPTGDGLLLDFVLDVLSEALRTGVPEGAVEALSAILPRLKQVAARGEDIFLRSKAKSIIAEVEKVLGEYYRSHQDEAKALINRLLVMGEYERARDLAISIGDDFLLKWLLERMKGRRVDEFTPRVEVVAGRRTGPGAVVDFSPPSHQSEPVSRAADTEDSPGTVEVGFPPLEEVIENGDVETLSAMMVSRPDTVPGLASLLGSSDAVKRLNTLWVLSRLVQKLGRKELNSVVPLIPPLLEILRSGNPWERDKAARTLAVLASKGGRREVVERILETLSERPLPALEFFSYYFLYSWDGEAARAVLDFLRKALAVPELQFAALMVLDAITAWGMRPEVDITVFEPFLMEVLSSGDESSRKVAARIMERFKTT
ncbi:hypothetical protein E3E36_06610 [Thermococcus sp. M36]|uniref:hypothetical protein n=1 Tax=Thermococcus sp. M36 TaxID=1638261 RepID=UPI00143C87C8|nr:hypothetical protein [Thermococcus sp. M36]NJE05819.1 hypothetical protein [Thermococcus sp. M36]